MKKSRLFAWAMAIFAVCSFLLMFLSLFTWSKDIGIRQSYLKNIFGYPKDWASVFASSAAAATALWVALNKEKPEFIIFPTADIFVNGENKNLIKVIYNFSIANVGTKPDLLLEIKNTRDRVDNQFISNYLKIPMISIPDNHVVDIEVIEEKNSVQVKWLDGNVKYSDVNRKGLKSEFFELAKSRLAANSHLDLNAIGASMLSTEDIDENFDFEFVFNSSNKSNYDVKDISVKMLTVDNETE